MTPQGAGARNPCWLKCDKFFFINLVKIAILSPPPLFLLPVLPRPPHPLSGLFLPLPLLRPTGVVCWREREGGGVGGQREQGVREGDVILEGWEIGGV
jgi:hypothetical protein